MLAFKDQLPQNGLAFSWFDILNNYACDLLLSCHINHRFLTHILASRHYWDWITRAIKWSQFQEFIIKLIFYNVHGRNRMPMPQYNHDQPRHPCLLRQTLPTQLSTKS